MAPPRRDRLTVLLVALLLPALPAGLAGQEASSDAVFLVRHAEKADDGTPDPPLAAEGEARAARLRDLLGDAGVDHVWTTNYRRTRETAAPLAGALGVQARLYDPSDLEGFAALLRRTPGRHLVVGHSNTTPALVEALGGRPGDPIAEPTEYDRLYVVVPGADSPRTILLRYGTPSPR